jgi:hypothetical protein
VAVRHADRAGDRRPLDALSAQVTFGPLVRDLSLPPIASLPGILAVSARRERELDPANNREKPGSRREG